MRRIISFLILICLILSLAACADKTPVQYYCTEMILEDLSIGDVTRTEYVYDQEWNNTQVITYLNEEEISRSSYAYSGDHVTVTTVYGELTEILEIENRKDEQGNIIKSLQSISGDPVCTTENTYDDQGNLLRSVSDYGSGFVSITEYTYDESGALLTETVSQEGFGILTRRECETGQDGIKTIRVLDAEGNLTGYYLVYCDDVGNTLQQEFYDPTGNLLSITTCTYLGTDGSISSGAAG